MRSSVARGRVINWSTLAKPWTMTWRIGPIACPQVEVLIDALSLALASLVA